MACGAPWVDIALMTSDVTEGLGRAFASVLAAIAIVAIWLIIALGAAAHRDNGVAYEGPPAAPAHATLDR